MREDTTPIRWVPGTMNAVCVLLIAWPMWHVTNGWAMLSLFVAVLLASFNCMVFLRTGHREQDDMLRKVRLRERVDAWERGSKFGQYVGYQDGYADAVTHSQGEAKS